jgi:hypothetical protein
MNLRPCLMPSGFRSCTTTTWKRSSGSSARRVDELVAAQRRHRNQPGGYWVAGAKPAAAYEAVAGSLPRSLITRAALLSDGVSCLVERYGAGDWSWLLTVLQDQGPGRLIARARELEGSDPAGAR